MSDDTEDRLRAATEKIYADFRAEQQARGRPVCDGFEPCDAAKTSPSPWTDAPEYTPCKRCSWSKRTHESGVSPHAPVAPIADSGTPTESEIANARAKADGVAAAFVRHIEAASLAHLDKPHVATLPDGSRVELPTTEREIQERRLQELREGVEKGADAGSVDVSRVPPGKSA